MTGVAGKRQRDRGIMTAAIRALILVYMLTQAVYASDSITCQSFYLNPTSIGYGRLFLEANDLETIESLNERSKDLIFAMENPEPLDHLINTLLYYRALERVLTPIQLAEQFPPRQFRFLYFTIKGEAHGDSKKFNYFRSHLLGRRVPVLIKEPATH